MMTGTRTQHRREYERLVAAEIEDVWRALTDPDDEQQHAFEHVVESTLMPGEPIRYLDGDDEPMIVGTIVDVDPPHRLVHTFAYTAAADPATVGDAQTRVTWALEPSDEGTTISIVHDGFDSQNATWRAVDDSWDQVLDGLIGLFEVPGDGE
jgi:uncharacterized protein YndB with AHSA1/START domain